MRILYSLDFEGVINVPSRCNEFHTHLLTCFLQVVLFQQSAVSFGGFLSFGDRNLSEVMVLDNSFQSIFKSLFKDMFECHENGIIEELKSVWIMVSVLSLYLLASLSFSLSHSVSHLLMLVPVALYRECTAECDMFVKSIQ